MLLIKYLMIKSFLSKYKNKKIAILGYGVNNLELVNFFVKNKIFVTICDRDTGKSLIKSSKYIKWQLGDDYLDNLDTFDVVFRSPGIPFFHPKIQQAKKKGVEINSQTKLFFDLCPAKIIGVTGTKGKGTTSTLIYKILKKSGKKVYLAGNIGQDPFVFLPKLRKTDWVVLELSSFQLQDLHKSPHIAVVLNTTVDHLDHHKNIKEYREAKESIVLWQKKTDFKVVNFDYESSRKFAEIGDGKNYFFSTSDLSLESPKGRLKRSGERISELFGYIIAPSESPDRGLRRVDESITNSFLILKEKNKEYQICSTKKVGLLGAHNLENITAGIIASRLAGATFESIRSVVKSFKGLPHRLELAGEKNGVKYYNDSFSTNSDTTIAAIKSFTAPIVLILGGSDKGLDYTNLAKEVLKAKNIKAIILIGQTAEKILQALQSKGSDPLKGVRPQVKTGLQNMKQVIEYASQISTKGDVVLLSPASASFGMFRDYKERGELFKKEVSSIRL
jgi:UDP-N-acetylmuramoylalanine--D-glutamate ligase